MSKEILIQELLKLPDGVSEFLDTPFPTIDPISIPATTEDAILANGIAAANINNLLAAYSGLKPVQILMRLSQHHPAIISLLLANLEAVSAIEGGFTIVSPENGGSYPGYFESWLVEGEGITGVSVSLDDGYDLFDLEESAGQWSKNWPVAMGDHTAVVTATFGNEQKESQSVSFNVVSWDIWPPDGGTITSLDDLNPVSCTYQGDTMPDVEEATVNIGGQTYTMSVISGSVLGIELDYGVWDALPEGQNFATFRISIAGHDLLTFDSDFNVEKSV